MAEDISEQPEEIVKRQKEVDAKTADELHKIDFQAWTTDDIDKKLEVLDKKGDVRLEQQAARQESKKYAQDNGEALRAQAAREMIQRIGRDANAEHPAGQNEPPVERRDDHDVAA